MGRTQKVTRPDGVLLREIEGESVHVNLDKGQYYGLDDVGTRLYQLLNDSPTRVPPLTPPSPSTTPTPGPLSRTSRSCSNGSPPRVSSK